jgi:hypothetical protein
MHLRADRGVHPPARPGPLGRPHWWCAGITLQPESFWAFGRIALRKPHLRRLPTEGEGRSALRQAECRLAIAQPRRERPALKLAPLENRVVLLDEGAGSLPVVGGLAAVDVVGRLEV